MMPQSCPDAEQLRRLLVEQHPGPDAQAVEAHVETCAGCQEALEELTAGAQATQAWEKVPEEVLRRLEAGPTPAPTLVPARPAETEVRDLLRSRLRFLAAMSFVAFVLYAGMYVSLVPTDPLTLSLYAILLALTGGLTLLLGGRRPLTTAQLRWVEVVFFAAVATFQTRLQFLIHHNWPVSFRDGDVNGPLMYARALDFNWAIFVIAYGLVIPNTWRRAVVLVAMMACWPVVLNALFGLPGATAGSRAMVVIASALNMSLASAMALFGARRFEALREEADRARRLGQYQLKSKLGSGGMGEVWLAEHVLLRRPCAVKLIRPEHVGDARFLRRFEREVKATAGLSHPNTIEVYDYGHAEDGTFYYAMEYLPGLSLEELVRQSGPLPAGRAVHLLRQVCGALAEAHGVGLVHRDVKPGNVIVCERGGVPDVAKLLDFGLVRSEVRPGSDATLTEVGTIAGTPAYMSPEQARGDTADARSDLYSVGAVAYFLLTGQPPFVRASAVQTLAAHLGDPVVPPGQLRSGPADVEAVVMRCLEKDPSRRFQSAGELDRALASCGGREELPSC
jgi:eukaryotic-like serine/threonine-protein kinase